MGLVDILHVVFLTREPCNPLDFATESSKLDHVTSVLSRYVKLYP